MTSKLKSIKYIIFLIHVHYTFNTFFFMQDKRTLHFLIEFEQYYTYVVECSRFIGVIPNSIVKIKMLT